MLSGRHIGIVDVPGHEKLVHNMLAGVMAIDYVLLVVAADDGPMQQTREHLELLDLLGLTQGAVALTRIDVVPGERRLRAQQEISELLDNTSLADSPIFPVSGQTGEGVVALRTHLETTAINFQRPPTGGHFRMAIDRCFSLTGVGTVVTGTALNGDITVDDKVVIAPAGFKARVRGLHVQDRPAEHGQSGERCALAIKGDFGKQDIERGMWLVDSKLVRPLSRFQAELRVPAGQKSLKHMQSVHVHLGSDDILGRVSLLDCKTVQAGDTALVEILLERDTLALRGDRFILRDAGAQRTVAGGRVLDSFPPRRHKRTPQRLALLDAMRNDDPAVSLALLAEQSETGVDLACFTLSWNLAQAEAETLWQQCELRVLQDGDATIGITSQAWAQLRRTLLGMLAEEHERAPDMIGVEPERLRRMISVSLSHSLFQSLVDELLSDKSLVRTRSWLHLPEHRASISTDDYELFAEFRPLLEASPFNPPRVRDIHHSSGTPEYEVRQLFRRLARAGELYPVAKDHYFTADAVAALAQIVQQLNEEQGAARASAFRDIIFADGSGGRKVAIRILEFFDRIGYTRRVHDDHLLRQRETVHQWTSC